MEINEIIEGFIKQDYYQGIIDSDKFYYDELSKVYGDYKKYNVEPFKNKLEEFIEKQPDPFRFQNLLDSNINTPYYDFLMLIGKLIAMFDEKGYNKNTWNTYEDKRVVSRAQFTQRNWTYCLFKYKLNNFNFQGLEQITFSTFRYVIEFVESPEQNVNITSQGHRKQIVDHFKLATEKDIVTLFAEYTDNVKNTKNKGVLVAAIIYHPLIKKIWLDGVIGLMASDGTGWQDEHIEEIPDFDASIIWNSKRPSGTSQTLKFLRNIIEEGGTFPLYYSSGGIVNYRAIIADFVENQKELDERQWNKESNILYFNEKFEDYRDTKKSAKIVFLANTIEKINPVPVSDFQFYNGYDAPRQDNISPIKVEPETITAMATTTRQYPIAEFEKMFKDYLNRVIPASASTYSSAIPAIHRIGVRLALITESLYEIQQPSEYATFFNTLKNDGEYLEKNGTSHNLYSSSLKKYKEFLDEINPTPVNKSSNNYSDMSLNQILFGPPGTGKTYNSINKAISIIENVSEESLKAEPRDSVKARFDNFIKEGRVAFTTFHQSMSYEDFVEGIKPLEPENPDDPLTYSVLDGLFKISNTNALFEFVKLEKHNNISANDFESKYFTYLNKVNEELSLGKPIKIPTKSGGTMELFKVSKQGNFWLRAVGGEEKYTVSADRLEPLYNKFYDLSKVKNLNEEFRSVIGGMNSTAYWAILNQLKTNSETAKEVNLDNLSYDDKVRMVAGLDSAIIKKHMSSAPKHVLIIDEINRGNVSQIFGELITLLEEDKRAGMNEEISLILPYSGPQNASKNLNIRFKVAPNLHIVGSMNTADRSVESLDTALRRRFVFEEIPPIYDLKELQYDFAGSKAFEILQVLNKRIEKLLDKDHQIGHSYFILKKDEKPQDKLITSFYKSIIPLLQEYFFGDFGKIGLVLGKGFVSLKNWDSKTDSFAEFDHESSGDFESRDVFEIVDYRSKDLGYTLEINKKETAMDFEKAIKLLMKQNIA